MILYSIIITLSLALVFTFNYFFAIPYFGFSAGFLVIAILVNFVSIVAINGLTAFIMHQLPDKYKNPYSKFFVVSKRERKLYEALGVKRWKHLLPDLGAIVNFKKGKIENPRSKEYVYKYLTESCAGELGHAVSVLTGALIVFIFPIKFAFALALPIIVVNAILNILPIISLRYNRFKLLPLHRRLSRNEEKENKEIIQETTEFEKTKRA